MKGALFTYALTGLGVVGSFINPFYGLLVYVCFAVIRPEHLWAHELAGGNSSRIVAVAMLASWVLRLCGDWKVGKARGVSLLFIGFWLWAAVGATIARDQAIAWSYVESMAKILLPFLVGITTIRTVNQIRALAWTLAISESYIAFEMNMYYFSGNNVLWKYGFGGVDNNSAAIGLVTALGVAFFLLLGSRKYWQQGILLLCCAFLGHAILFSFSRGAMVATILSGCVAFVLIRKSAKHYVIFALACVAALMLAGPEVRSRFLMSFEVKKGRHEASAQSRLDLWKDCLTLLQDNPVLGIGPDHWPSRAHEFGWEKNKEAHSLWVQTATETGIPGISMFLGFYLLCIWRCWRLLPKLCDDDDPWFGDGCRITIAALSGFMVSAQFVSLEYLELPYYVVLLGAATLSVYGKQQQQRQREIAIHQASLAASGGLDPESPSGRLSWMDNPAPSEFELPLIYN